MTKREGDAELKIEKLCKEATEELGEQTALDDVLILLRTAVADLYNAGQHDPDRLKFYAISQAKLHIGQTRKAHFRGRPRSIA